jgi:hypothetical protein
MKGELYLYVSRDTGPYAAAATREVLAGRISARKDKPKSDEVEFKLTLEIPNELFQKPTYEAHLSIRPANGEKTIPKLEVSADAVEVWLGKREEKE